MNGGGAGAMISAWSVISPFGIGTDAFVSGWDSGADPAGVPDRDVWGPLPGRACLVPDFDVRRVLGKKGTRSMDRVTALAVATMGELIGDTGDLDAERTAIALGTTTGSAQSIMQFTRASLTGQEPFHVDPALMPNVVMNCAAGQCGIWYGIKGPNTTVASGRVAGLQTLQYASRLLSFGRAGRVLCGAAEEYSYARAWLESHARTLGAGDDGSPLGEGCAMLMVEPAHSAEDPLAEVLVVRSRVFQEGDIRGALCAAVRDALAEARVDSGHVWAAVHSGASGQAGLHEREALADLFSGSVLNRVSDMARLGDLGAAASAFQISALLATARQEESVSGRVAVLTSVDRDGSVVCGVLRILR